MIQSRTDLIDYAFRALGSPVIKIEVDMTQVADRVDDALQFFQDFHYDGVERCWLKHQVTGTQIAVDAPGLQIGDTVTGTTGITFKVADLLSPTTIITNNVYSSLGVSGATPGAGEVLTNQTGTSVGFVSKVAGDTENGWIPVNAMVTGVSRVVPFRPIVNQQNFMFDPTWNMIGKMNSLGSGSMIYYEQVMEYIEFIDQVLRPMPQIQFNRKMDRIYFANDTSNVQIGSYLLVEVFRILDPDTFTKIYDDRLLKKLVTALIKKQWAQNTSKYQNIQLLGGVTIDSSTLMAQAEAEIGSATQEIRDSYEIPPIGFMG